MCRSWPVPDGKDIFTNLQGSCWTIGSLKSTMGWVLTSQKSSNTTYQDLVCFLGEFILQHTPGHLVSTQHCALNIRALRTREVKGSIQGLCNKWDGITAGIWASWSLFWWAWEPYSFFVITLPLLGGWFVRIPTQGFRECLSLSELVGVLRLQATDSSCPK